MIVFNIMVADLCYSSLMHWFCIFSGGTMDLTGILIGERSRCLGHTDILNGKRWRYLPCLFCFLSLVWDAVRDFSYFRGWGSHYDKWHNIVIRPICEIRINQTTIRQHFSFPTTNWFDIAFFAIMFFFQNEKNSSNLQQYLPNRYPQNICSN